MSETPSSPPETFPLRRGGSPIALHATGFRHPGGLFAASELFTSYASVTQLVVMVRGLRVATRNGVFLLRRGAFVSADGPEALVRALYARILAQPGGALQLARMQRLNRWMLGPQPHWVSRGVSLSCVVVFILQGVYFPWVELAGAFSADLVATGEWWRLVTANFLHAFPLPVHLILNAICLLGLGLLVERSLGSARAALVMAASAIGAMGGSYLAGYQWAVGASGIVAGLVGGLIWLEFRRPEQLPAIWRIPRRLFIAAVAGETAFLLFVPGIAHAAHLGGFLTGAVATAAIAPPVLGTGSSPRWLAPACAATALAVGVAVLAAVWPLLAPSSPVAERRAAHLLSADVEPLHLNNVAWTIVTGPAPGIEEAIFLAPGVEYFREQRRRFTGERESEDRPAPPDESWQPRPEPLPPQEEPGIRV
jgi:membrane associated rhomboid family serine protease